jgi:hypothetical protein
MYMYATEDLYLLLVIVEVSKALKILKNAFHKYLNVHFCS